MPKSPRTLPNTLDVMLPAGEADTNKRARRDVATAELPTPTAPMAEPSAAGQHAPPAPARAATVGYARRYYHCTHCVFNDEQRVD
jgi:hypothetical protein